MGFFDIFSTSEKAVEVVGYAAKKGVDGIDALFYTDEEQAGDAMEHAKLRYKFGELALKKTEQAMGESSAQTLSRRYMAWFIVFNAGLMSWAYIVGATFEWLKLSNACWKMLDYWKYALGGVIGFYFLTHAGRAFMGSKK